MLKVEILLETLWDKQRVGENSGSLPLCLVHELPVHDTELLDRSVPGVPEVGARAGRKGWALLDRLGQWDCTRKSNLVFICLGFFPFLNKLQQNFSGLIQLHLGKFAGQRLKSHLPHAEVWYFQVWYSPEVWYLHLKLQKEWVRKEGMHKLTLWNILMLLMGRVADL